MAGLNSADMIILAILGLSSLISLFRGFVRETLSLASWILAFLTALFFGHTVSDVLLQNYIHSPTLRLAAAFGGLFILTLIACGIVSYFIYQLVDKTGLSGTDRLLGIIFGAARGVFVVGALLLAAHLTPLPQETVWKESFLIPYFEPLELWLKNILPKSLGDHFELAVKKI